MDKFEEAMQKMEKMSEDEQKKVREHLKSICRCPGCPTYNSCMRENGERLFCLLGKSTCSVAKKACLCPGCPVAAKMGLNLTFYCTGGSEAERRKK
jgi:Protein of unknown function (DUF2769)